MKVLNLALNVLTAIGYPFILVFAFIFIFTMYPLGMLMYFPDGTEEGTEFYEFKNEFIERWCSPKKFLTNTWQICKYRTCECILEMIEDWLYTALLIICLLTYVVSLIFC